MIYQNNAGVSVARSVGIEVAKGKYIVFADGDDFVAPDPLLNFVKSEADFVIAGFCDYYHEKIIKRLLPMDVRHYCYKRLTLLILLKYRKKKENFV